MVKIKELKDTQLDEQIAKYQKILDELNKEKVRRGGQPSGGQEDFFVDFSDEEISEMEKNRANEEITQKANQEEVNVTKLLQLSAEDREALLGKKKK